MTFRFAELVGRYRLVVSDALLEFVERAFVEPALPSERDAVRREALDEATEAELVIEADGTIVSRAGEREFYRIRVDTGPGELEELRFEKPPSGEVRLVWGGANRLFAHQPNKPIAEFRREP